MAATDLTSRFMKEYAFCLAELEPTLRVTDLWSRRRAAVLMLNDRLADFFLESCGADHELSTEFRQSRRVLRSIDEKLKPYVRPADDRHTITPDILGETVERFAVERTRHGVWYTPRPIVEYICRETLATCLGMTLTQAEQLTDGQRKLLCESLRALKIIDPACGCGAFLVGMFQELLRWERLLTGSNRPTLSSPISNLYGLDLDDLAVHTTRLRLRLEAAATGDNNLRLDDFPQVQVGDALGAQHSLIPDSTFDIVITNPPFGVTAPVAVRDRFFDPRTNGSQSRDVYALFVARSLELLKDNGVLGILMSNTWRTIRRHRPLRKRLLDTTTVHKMIDLPGWIFPATVNTGILVLSKGTSTPDHRLMAADLRSTTGKGLLKKPSGVSLRVSRHPELVEGSRDRSNLAANPSITSKPQIQLQSDASNDLPFSTLPKDWNSLKKCFSALERHECEPDASNVVYSYPQHQIGSYENLSFFIASPKLHARLADNRFTTLGEIATVRQGLATGDNKHYLRKQPGAHGAYRAVDSRLMLTDRELIGLSSVERLNGVHPDRYAGRHFVPYDKGGASDSDQGWLPNYYVPTEYCIDWSQSAVRRMKTTRSDRQGGKVAARFQNSAYYFRRGLTFSYTGYYAPCFRLSSGGVFDVGGSSCFDIRLPLYPTLAILASKVVKYFARNFIDHTVNFQVDEFKALPVPREIDPGISARLEALVTQIVERQHSDPRYPYHLHEQIEIDRLVYQLFELTENDIREVEGWWGRRYARLGGSDQ
jgi:methylase of polypeptide subunit release factors